MAVELLLEPLIGLDQNGELLHESLVLQPVLVILNTQTPQHKFLFYVGYQPSIYCRFGSIKHINMPGTRQCCGYGSVVSMFLGLPDPDPLARGPNPDQSIIKQK